MIPFIIFRMGWKKSKMLNEKISGLLLSYKCPAVRFRWEDLPATRPEPCTRARYQSLGEIKAWVVGLSRVSSRKVFVGTWKKKVLVRKSWSSLLPAPVFLVKTLLRGFKDNTKASGPRYHATHEENKDYWLLLELTCKLLTLSDKTKFTFFFMVLIN